MSKKADTYHDARAKAQADANADGFDRGLEWNDLFKTWSHRMLPSRDYRFGYDARCEVVMCEDMGRVQKGHGPQYARGRAWSEANGR
jgi:hypothetical protein